MPGIRLVTNLTPPDALETAATVARRLGYTVQRDGGDLVVRKGNPVMGLLLGALTPYYDFRLYVDRIIPPTVTLNLQRNEPSGLLAGRLAVSQIRSGNEALADAVAEAIRNKGGEIFAREPF